MTPDLTAADLARAVSDARQHSDRAAAHEQHVARRADEADQHAGEAAIHADHAAQHERAAAIAAAQTLAHEQETLNLLEHARSEEEETHHLRQQAYVLLVDTRAHERDAAQALAQIEHRLDQPATAADPAEAAPSIPRTW